MPRGGGRPVTATCVTQSMGVMNAVRSSSEGHQELLKHGDVSSALLTELVPTSLATLSPASSVSARCHPECSPCPPLAHMDTVTLDEGHLLTSTKTSFPGSHILRCWGEGFDMSFWGAQSKHNYTLRMRHATLTSLLPTAFSTV